LGERPGQELLEVLHAITTAGVKEDDPFARRRTSPHQRTPGRARRVVRRCLWWVGEAAGAIWMGNADAGGEREFNQSCKATWKHGLARRVVMRRREAQKEVWRTRIRW